MFEHNVAVSWNCHRAAFALVALLLSFAASAQQLTNSRTETLGLTPGPYAVGFRLLADQDHSRPITGADAKTHARPMRIYVWYPARNVAKPLRFGRYAELSDNDVWPAEITGREREVLRFSRGPLARSLDPTALDALLRRPTLAAENARPAAGSFPLIVIGLGLYYESPITFAALGEYLAGRGFVVATVPLIGTSSALVRIDAQDLETQVRDLEFAIARARQLPFVNPVRIGVVGFDMGGMAGVILAMRHPGVGAFASLDSGIVYPHPSGLPQASPSYDPLALRVPWLHAAQPRLVERPQDPSAKSLFDTAVYSNRYLLKTEGMGHVDFTSYALIDGRRAMPAYWGDPQADAARRHGIVAEYLANFFAAFLRMDATSVGWLARDPQAVFPGSQMTIEHRAATPPSISYDELVQAIVDGKGEQAIEQLRVANAANALDQTHLERLAVSLLYTWGLTKESLPLLAFTAERYPASVQAQAMLIDAYVLLENYPAAIEILSAFVQQHPDNPGARARLDEVRKLQDREHK